MRAIFYRGRRYVATVLCGFVLMGWFAAGTLVARSPSVFAEPGPVPAPRGPAVGQSCDDPLKLAFDPSAGEIVCTRGGQWMSSVNPTAVRSLGAPWPTIRIGADGQNAR